jgi:hypothetical protein
MIRCPVCGTDNNSLAVYCARCQTDLILNTVPLSSLQDMIPQAPDTVESVPTLQDVSTEEHGAPKTEPLTSVKLITRGVARQCDPAEIPTAVLPVRTDGSAPAVEFRPRLVVLRGEKINMEYPVYEGANYIGRTDEQPVDIDLECQEAADRVLTSRQHACVHYEDGALTVEDLKSLNGTFVNRRRVYPGQRRPLQDGDVIQVGTVQLKVVL